MIAVSNEFKKAIKEQERQIKGYVEVLYDIPSIEVTATTNMTSTYTDISEVVSGNRVSDNYGTLDYLPLDGSILTMDTSNNTNSGFITDDLSNDINAGTVTLSFAETKINGLTIYYEDNTPESVSYTFSDGTTATSGGNQIDQVIFDNPKTLTSIQIDYSTWEYEDRKIRINEIDLGISQIYKDQDLIEFTIDEEVNKLVEETPINETNITLNNMSDLFNPLNPSGIVPYLSENTLIIPYIGVLTENLGVEYVKMGEFYFDSYTNNSDSTTTLTGKNLIKKINSEILNDNNEMNFFFGLHRTKNQFLQYMQNYDYTLGNIDWTKNICYALFEKDKLLDLLKETAFIQNNLLYFDRNNTLNLKSINNTNMDTLTKTELINDVEFKYVDKINILNCNYTYENLRQTVASRKVLENKVKLEKSPQIFLLKSNIPIGIDTITQSGGTSATSVDSTPYLIFVKVSGTVGDEVNITINSTEDYGSDIYTKTIKSGIGETPVVLDFNSNLCFFTTLSSDKFNIIPSYEMKFEYNGDPSLEAGDYINVETPYGYKPLFIQKNYFKFDGGLEGSIEGVE